MAVFDIRSDLKLLSVFDDSIGVAGDSFGAIVDTSNFENGLVFAAYHDGSDGIYAISFQQSDTGAFAGEETAVPAANLIGDDINFDASSGFRIVETQGVFSNLKFVRPAINASGVTVDALIVIIAIEGAEETPDQDDVIGN